MVRDAAWRPQPYRLIYIGEAGNLAERVVRSHEKYESWRHAAGGAQLFVAFHAVEGTLIRRVREKKLIEHYEPECNKTFNRNALAVRSLVDLYSYGPNWPFHL
jgi:hypothetical protein